MRRTAAAMFAFPRRGAQRDRSRSLPEHVPKRPPPRFGRTPVEPRSGHHGRPHREGLPGREGTAGYRLLRRADAARQGELPHHRHPDVDRAVFRQGLRLRQEGGRAGQPRPRRARCQGRRRDRRRLRPADRRRDARPVRHRLHPGRRRHLDQHERQRGDRQPRAGEPRPPEGRVPVRQPERSRQFRPVDQRHLPDGVPAGADPAPGQLHGGAAPAAGGVLRQGQGVRPGAEDGPHAPAGRGADVARPGVPRLGHDHRRGSAAHRRGAPVPARDQPRRDGDRHLGDRGAGLPRAGHQLPVRAHRHASSSSPATWSRRPPTPAPTCCCPACSSAPRPS